jgi:DNA-binding transcriptional regulator GbsR (MarR family)
MIFWILRQIIISFLFIFTMHNIYNYFKTNLTVPKIKDLIKKPKQQYKDIYENEEKTVDKESMKNELKDYLKNLSKTSNATKLESVGDIFNDSDGNSSSFTSY